jgi:hypothetical protein
VALAPVREEGFTLVEGPPETVLMAAVGDVNLVIEACFSAGTRAALLYATNLTPSFFDVSSREAGEILQKLRHYGIHVAVVREPDRPESRRFDELLAAERRDGHFDVFDDRDSAVSWLAGHDASQTH